MFSILMSVYGKDNLIYFSDAMQSIISQTYLPKEFVLVCDGPLSNDYNILINEFKSKFTRLDVVFTIVQLDNNVGLGSALHSGLSYCNQDYIVRMDSDDVSVPNRLDYIRDCVKTNPDLDLLGFQIEEFDTIPGDLKIFRSVPLSKESIAKYAKKRNPFNHVTVCIKRKAILDLGGYESVIFHEDYFLWVKFIVNNMNYCNFNFVSVFVRVGNDLMGRRLGYNYFKHECNFCLKAYQIHFFNFFDVLKYLFPRIFLRFSPSFITSSFYKKFLRN